MPSILLCLKTLFPWFLPAHSSSSSSLSPEGNDLMRTPYLAQSVPRSHCNFKNRTTEAWQSGSNPQEKQSGENQLSVCALTHTCTFWPEYTYNYTYTMNKFVFFFKVHHHPQLLRIWVQPRLHVTLYMKKNKKPKHWFRYFSKTERWIILCSRN